MSEEKNSGIRGVFRDIGLVLGDLVTMGRIKPERELTLEVLFGLLGYLAKSDSIVTSHESDFANALMDELDLPIAGRRVASEAFENGRLKNLDVEASLTRFLQAHPAGSPESDKLYDALLRLATADGRLFPREMEFLERVTKGLGLPDTMLQARLSLYLKK